MAANASAVWRVRPSGNNNNGGGYDAGIASAGTDFSQQNAAQVTQSGGTISTATVTLTDSGASFTSALIGNGIRVAGTGITTTYTFITAVPTGTTLTLQTSPGTTGTSVTYSIGGGWAEPNTVPGASTNPVVPGNTIYILGTGVPNPAAYSADYTLGIAGSGSTSGIKGNATVGKITWANDPLTPGYKAPPDTTGGMPLIRGAGGALAGYQDNYVKLQGLWFVAADASNASLGMLNSTGFVSVFGCVFDQAGFDLSGIRCQAGELAIGNEVFSSTGGSGGSNVAAYFGDGSGPPGYSAIGNNLHDSVGPSLVLDGSSCSSIATDNILAKCSGDGISVTNGYVGLIKNNTIDGNTGHGITLSDQNTILNRTIMNNIISNHTGGGKVGLIVGTGTAAQNSAVVNFCDYNVFYNNTANYSGINAGPHDTVLGSDPYVAQSTENYTLA